MEKHLSCNIDALHVPIKVIDFTVQQIYNVHTMLSQAFEVVKIDHTELLLLHKINKCPESLLAVLDVVQ